MNVNSAVVINLSKNKLKKMRAIFLIFFLLIFIHGQKLYQQIHYNEPNCKGDFFISSLNSEIKDDSGFVSYSQNCSETHISRKICQSKEKCQHFQAKIKKCINNIDGTSIRNFCGLAPKLTTEGFIINTMKKNDLDCKGDIVVRAYYPKKICKPSTSGSELVFCDNSAGIVVKNQFESHDCSGKVLEKKSFLPKKCYDGEEYLNCKKL